jgi:hypothetical protein
MWGVVQANLEDIKLTWVEKRCNPLYMPFVNVIDPSTSVFQNLQYCSTSFASQVFSRALAVIHTFFGQFTKVLNMVIDQFGSLRSMATGLITFIMSFIDEIFSKIRNTFGVMVALLSRIRNLTNRIMGSAGYAATTMITVANTLTAIVDWLASLVDTIVGIIIGLAIVLSLIFPVLLFFFIPIGIAMSVTGFSCFHPDTLVRKASGNLVPIREVKVGDILTGGSRVTATMRFTTDDVKLYNYKNVIVAGQHLVCEDGVWMYVKNSAHALLYDLPYPSEIICLNTSNHHIWIGGIQFSDYEEIEEEIEMTPLDPKTPIDCMGAYIPLRECQPGMMTTAGKIHGVVKLEDGMMQLFMDNEQGVIPLIQNKYARDYADSHDPQVLATIQMKVLEELNKKSA